MPQDQVSVGLYLWSMGSLEADQATAEAYEQLGIDSGWVIDHFLGFAHPELWPELPASAAMPSPDAFLDPFCVAVTVAGKTNLQLGSAVIDLTRRAPIDMARAMLTVHHACPNGFIFGVGSGIAVNREPFGFPMKGRVGAFERNLVELRHILDTGRMPDGVGYMGLPLESEAGRPQIWVAGHGPRMRQIAGRLGDGWITSGVDGETYPDHRREVMDAAAAAGRAAPTTAFSPFVFLGESRDAVAEALERKPLAKLVALFAPAAMWDDYGVAHPTGSDAAGYTDALPHRHDPEELRAVADRIPFELFERLVFCGSAEDIAKRMRPYVDAGLEHVIFADTTGMALQPEDAAALMTEFPRIRELLNET